ncbi:MAG: FKBP-type peptidyl-prolyl cis-trans isomerase [Nocardioides sp.]|uniref:FKBP-type peptidyl-prolyl cis-trans isomerase n=1 Tax=Nocardioides sp. TaxID=35761 RepID=UPI0039E46129
MFSRLRVAAVVLPLLVSLVACGSEDKSVGLGAKTLDGFKAATISGDVGTAPTVDWKGQMSQVDKVATKTVVAGDGAEVAKGDTVNAYIWLGNGYTKKQAYSDYDKGASEALTADSTSLSEVFEKLLVGSKIGSRVAAVASATDIFGDAGSSSMGIANQDPLLIIVDIVSEAITSATDTTPDKVPSVKTNKKGVVTGLNFKGIAKPDDANGLLLRATITEGTGEEVKADDTVKVNYLGMTYKAKKAFDESYSGDAAEFSLSQVVKGWTYGLTGVKVGSRVILQIPPILGYGSQEQTGIPANSTLYFVVDVIGRTSAADASASASASAEAEASASAEATESATP